MAYVFYVLGMLGLFGGLLWTGMAFRAVGQLNGADPYYSAGLAIGAFATMSPGIGLMVVGLFLLAIGGILGRLDRIARYSRMTHRLIKDSYSEPAD
jgi:hypothetical protein